jgi:hypothetical protein
VNRISAHDLAAVIATLVIQPEAFGRPVADEDYENLLADFGEVLGRDMEVTMLEVLPPDPPRSGYTLIYESSPPSHRQPSSSMDLPVDDDARELVPMEPHRSSISAMLHALAERVR